MKPTDDNTADITTVDAKPHQPDGLQDLKSQACHLGASQAAIISTTNIAVHEHLADLCRQPECKAYGLSASCPPHVRGPSEFRRLLTRFDWAVCLKIDVPTEILLSDERMHVYQLLHKIVATIETAAVDQGCTDARAFAGGSCKQIFCPEQKDCRVVAAGRTCRHPQHARPSMSGFGIDVSRFMQAAGWQLPRITRDTEPETIPMGSVSGLVLVC